MAIRNLFFGESIKEAIDAPRIHNQLFPNKVKYEPQDPKFPDDILKKLRGYGHDTAEIVGRGSVVMAINKKDGKLYANSDFRKNGAVDGN